MSEQLDRLLRERQADRLPSVAAAVVCRGATVWADAVGFADYESGLEATPATQYRIGSITKTFTATAIMQLRDAGALDLDDRLEQHLDGVENGSPTIRRMLSHLSGLQREVGEMFVEPATPTEDELVVGFALPPARAHHYSNLAFALLGRVVSARSGLPYREYVDERVIRPLGFERTTWYAAEPSAQGYLVDEYAHTAAREPALDLGAGAAAGQLWSTVDELARLATFLARGEEGVLSPATVEEMWFPQVMYYPDDWVLGWGLGLQLYNRQGARCGRSRRARRPGGAKPPSRATARASSPPPAASGASASAARGRRSCGPATRSRARSSRSRPRRTTRRASGRAAVPLRLDDGAQPRGGAPACGPVGADAAGKQPEDAVDDDRREDCVQGDERAECHVDCASQGDVSCASSSVPGAR